MGILLLPLAAGPLAADGPPTGLPRLVIEASSIDLGIVAIGEPAVASFTLRNTGNAPLEILKVKPG